MRISIDREGDEIHGTPCDKLFALSEKLKIKEPIYTTIDKSRLYFPFITCNKTLAGIIKIFNNSIPFPSQILFCHLSTQWKDVISFVYKSVTDPEKKLHVLVHCENLSTEVQNQFIALFDRLLSDSQLRFKLGILTLESHSSYIAAYFKNFSKVKIIDSDIRDIDISKIIDKTNASVYISKKSGFGKTTAIRSEAERANKELVEFNLIGRVSIAQLCDKLSNIELTPKHALYFKISGINNPEIVDEFLTCICLFRTLNYSDYLITIPIETEIYIEVANIQDKNLYNSISCLKFIETREVKFSIENLNISGDINLPFLAKRLMRHANDKECQTYFAKKNWNNLVICWLKKYSSETKLNYNKLGFAQINAYFSILYVLVKNFGKASNIVHKFYSENRKMLFPKLKINITKKDLKKKVFNMYLRLAEDLTWKSAKMVEKAQLDSWNILYKNNLKVITQYEEEKSNTDILNCSTHSSQLIIFNEEARSAVFSNNSRDNPDQIWELLYAFSNLNQNPTKVSRIPQNFEEIINGSNKLSIDLLQKLRIFFKNSTTSVNYQNYIITQDNYLKMHLINLRAISKVPIVIVGETGCGKTALIKFFVTEIINQKFKKIDIHSETTIEMIKNDMSEIITEAINNPSSSSWILFDEFNTTENIGIICDIICSRRLDGRDLPQNIILLGTCNPFKASKQKRESIGIKNYRIDSDNLKLVHYVKPLPSTMIDFAWDFGTLTKEDFKSYVLTMLENSYQALALHHFIWKFILLLKMERDKWFKDIFKKYIESKSTVKITYQNKEFIDLLLKLMFTRKLRPAYIKAEYQIMLQWKLETISTGKYLFMEMICISHEYFKRNEDESSVSLRDVSRFIKIKSWFANSINERSHIKNLERYDDNVKKYNLKIKEYQLDLDLRAGILSFCVCYYLRILTENSRKEFLDFIIENMNKNEFLEKEYRNLEDILNTETILYMLESEQDDWIARMDLKKDIAVNKPLKENIFCMIVCILNQVPLLICGKPGSSKSLSIELVFSNLKGAQSYDLYFKKLPSLIEVPFQGSDSCKSEEISEIFDKANNYLEKSREKGGYDIPVIVFDEIGLADISKHNPLKVLHHLLEIENVCVGFVGISNWRLDASKMNRAIFLAREDPSREILRDTANAIYSFYSYEKPYTNIIEDLSDSYLELKDYFKNEGLNEFYGLRDFYCLIKRVSKELEKPIGDDKKVTEIIRLSVERNFGGLQEYSDQIKKLFNKGHYYDSIFSKSSSAPELINGNLNEHIEGSEIGTFPRYLMIIGNSNFGICAIDKILSNKLSSRQIMIGSCLKNDINNDNYAFNALSDMILYMFTGETVILKGMDQIYTALYDLFNQHFQWSGPSRYCKVALNSMSNSYCFVHHNFHTIVFLDQDKIKDADPPFLNRFEKHYLNIDSFLSHQSSKDILQKLIKWVEMFQVGKLKMNNLFPIYSEETLSLMILSSEGQSEDDILTNCKLQLLETASSMVMLLCIKFKDEIEKSFILKKWNELHSAEHSFIHTLNLMMNDEYEKNKLLAFTYDNASVSSAIKEEKSHNLLELMSIIKLCSCLTEKDICKNIKDYYETPKLKLLIFEIDFNSEHQHILAIKNFIDRFENKYRIEKNIIILCRMIGSLEYEKFIFHFESWKMKLFDEIQRTSDIDISDALSKNINTLIIENEIYEFEANLDNLFTDCMIKFKYNGIEDTDTYIRDIIKKVGENKDFIDALKYKLYNQSKNLKDLALETLDEIKDYKNLKTHFKMLIMNEIQKELISILYHLESGASFKSFLNIDASSDINNFKYWLCAFQASVFKRTHISNLAEIRSSPDLNFLFSIGEYDLISELYESHGEISKNKEKYQNCEFQDLYEEKSIYKDILAELNNDKHSMDLFFADLIKIYLFRNKINNDYWDILKKMVEVRIDNNDHFCQKLISYKSFEKGFVYIVNILNNSKIDINSILAWNFWESEDWNSFLSKFFENLIGIILNRILEEIKTDDPFVMSSDFNRTLGQIKKDNRVLLGKIFHNLIDVRICYPTISLKHQDILEFWYAFLTLIVNTSFNGHIEDIKNCIEDNYDYIFNQRFIDTALHFSEMIMQNASEEAKIEVYKFKVAFYKILINKDHKIMDRVIRELNSTDLWRYATKLLREIYEKSKVKAEINKINKLIDRGKKIPKFENEYLKEIEKCVNCEGKFIILFADLIYKMLDKVNFDGSKNEAKKLDYHTKILNDWERRFKFYIDYLNLDQPSLLTIIYSVQVRIYLESYSYLNMNRANIGDKDTKIINEIDEILKTSAISGTLRIYCIKAMMHSNAWKREQVYQYLRSNKNIEWIDMINDIPPSSRKIFPCSIEWANYYKNITIILDRIFKSPNIQDLTPIIQEGSSDPYIRLAFAQVFLNEVYMHHPLDKTVTENLIRWLEKNKSLITENFGEIFYLLFKTIINNSFPQNSSFCTKGSANQNDKHKILTLLTIFIITISFGKNENPISSVFFGENGTLRAQDISNQMNQMFIFAAELSPIYNYSKEKLDNWHNFISTSYSWFWHWLKGSTYICSNRCKYIYVIDGDGTPKELFNCPYCDKECGGVNKKLYEREEHRNISHEEAEQIMTSIVQNGNSEEVAMKGCKYFSLKNKKLYIRDLKEISARMLHLILGTSIYGFKCLDLANLGKIFDPKISNPENYLQESIENDLKVISDLTDLKPEENSHILIYNILSKLPQFLINSKYLPSTYDFRNKFEKSFEDQIIIPNIFNKISSIKKYEEDFQSNFNEKISDLDIIEEKVNTRLPLEKLFRVIGKPSFDKMRSDFNSKDLSSHYPIISEYLKNYSEIKTLECLYPIIEFTNYLLEKYNYCLTRKKCKKIKIKSEIDKAENEDFARLFEKFLVAWKSFDLKCISQSKNNKRKEIDKSSSLSCFLMDEADDQGKYLKLALQEFANIQSKVLDNIIESIKKQSTLIGINNYSSSDNEDKHIVHIDNAKFRIQEIKKENILEIENLETKYCYICSLNNPSYGEGKEVIYDYERISANLAADLECKKKLDASMLRYIQYKNEVLRSDIIEEIEKRVIQNANLNEYDKNIVKKYKIEVDKTQDGNKSSKLLKDCLRNLIDLMCILRNTSKSEDLSALTIKAYCSRLNLKKFYEFFRDKEISEIKLSDIVELHQKIESYYFPWYVEKFMKSEYKLCSSKSSTMDEIDRKKEIKDKIYSLIEDCDNIGRRFPSCKVLKTFIKRFIMRCLPEGIDSEQFISDYITRSDLWKLKWNRDEFEESSISFSEINYKNELIKGLMEIFPKEIPASYSLFFYETVMEKLDGCDCKSTDSYQQLNSYESEGEENNRSEEDEELDSDNSMDARY